MHRADFVLGSERRLRAQSCQRLITILRQLLSISKDHQLLIESNYFCLPFERQRIPQEAIEGNEHLPHPFGMAIGTVDSNAITNTMMIDAEEMRLCAL